MLPNQKRNNESDILAKEESTDANLHPENNETSPAYPTLSNQRLADVNFSNPNGESIWMNSYALISVK